MPSQTVTELVAEARRVGADAMVSFGGGSPIDTVKNAAWQLMGGRAGSRTIDFSEGTAQSGKGGDILHIAIPTTLSAGEFTPAGGVTDESTKVKGGVADPRLQAKAVILDPALTAETPAWLWASTGMRALDHAVEGSYSTRHQLVTDTLASKAIELLNAHLLPSLQTHGDNELEHRVQCQLAAWLSIFGMSNRAAESRTRWDIRFVRCGTFRTASHHASRYPCDALHGGSRRGPIRTDCGRIRRALRRAQSTLVGA